MSVFMFYAGNRNRFNSAGINAALVNAASEAAGRAALAAAVPYGDIDVSDWSVLNLTGLEVTAVAAVADGGSGYAAGEKITLTGGTAVAQAVLEVLTETAGAIDTVALVNPGKYTVVPTNPVAQGSSDGSGTGATFTLTTAVAVAAALPSARTIVWIEGNPASMLGITRGGKALPIE